MQCHLASFVQIDEPYVFHSSVFGRKLEELGFYKLFAHKDNQCTPGNLPKRHRGKNQ